MWYIKDHLGNETGPFTFDELNSQLSQPALRERHANQVWGTGCVETCVDRVT